MDRLLTIANKYDTVVSTTRLPGDLLGCWVPDLRRIFLDSRLSPVEQRVVLAHELGHVHHGHTCNGTPSGEAERRQERQADVWAARMLVDPAEYARVERVNPDVHAIADELNVTVDVVLVFEDSTLTRVDGATYARPREGAGQWAHRVEVA